MRAILSDILQIKQILCVPVSHQLLIFFFNIQILYRLNCVLECDYWGRVISSEQNLTWAYHFVATFHRVRIKLRPIFKIYLFQIFDRLFLDIFSGICDWFIESEHSPRHYG